jgi:4-amino-4-deoxy-L-arabinose transferase-like glycosyltransferase
VVASPWYLFLIDRLGADFVWQQFQQQNFDRFGASNRGHGGKGLFYYFINSPADIGLWLLLLLPAIWAGFRHRRNDRTWRLLILWLVAPLLFFTLASTKRNVYLLPAFPAMALLIADWLANSVVVAGTMTSNNDQRWQQWSAWIVAGVLAVVGLGLLVASVVWGYLPTPKVLAAHPAVLSALQPAAVVLGVVIIAIGVSAWLMARKTPVKAWMLIGAGTTLGYVLALWLVMPVIDRMRSYQPAAAWITQRVPAGEAVGFFVPGREANKRPAWLCHLGGRRLEFFPTPEAATQWLAGAPGRLVISDPKNAPRIAQSHVIQEWNISSDAWLVLAAAGNQSVSPDPVPGTASLNMAQ